MEIHGFNVYYKSKQTIYKYYKIKYKYYKVMSSNMQERRNGVAFLHTFFSLLKQFGERALIWATQLRCA